ncbi:hypothetical protein ACFVHB_10805 [Kitasatospora sp. NPDC127111]|uniref:hypothetical protein n=1 Tax=Kitasatospora sp. NPDC127111 TaxID=3345363 RepID=UPI003630B56E
MRKREREQRGETHQVASAGVHSPVTQIGSLSVGAGPSGAGRVARTLSRALTGLAVVELVLSVGTSLLGGPAWGLAVGVALAGPMLLVAFGLLRHAAAERRASAARGAGAVAAGGTIVGGAVGPGPATAAGRTSWGGLSVSVRSVRTARPPVRPGPEVQRPSRAVPGPRRRKPVRGLDELAEDPHVPEAAETLARGLERLFLALGPPPGPPRRDVVPQPAPEGDTT